MVKKKKKVLISGFNARPLAKSLYQAEFDVYAVDFFGDSDLYPYVEDSKIIVYEMGTDYQTSKTHYSDSLADLTIEMIEKYPDLDYLIIASGLDDNIEGRERIFNKIKELNHQIQYLGNDNEVIEKARDILKIYSLIEVKGYEVPKTQPFDYNIVRDGTIQYPLILKKKQSSGGLSIFKINSKAQLQKLGKDIEEFSVIFKDWLFQDYIEGIDISCTTLSNHKEAKVISINKQLIGQGFLNAPSKFIYCGNIIPAKIKKSTFKLVSDISLTLVKTLELVGINGFDFVVKAGIPYLMEINPRIPGSIHASELYLDRNLLEEHISSCIYVDEPLITIGRTRERFNYVAKFIYFAPKDVPSDKVEKLKNLKHLRDIPGPDRIVNQQEPLCTVLVGADTYFEAFCGALDTIKKVEKIIN